MAYDHWRDEDRWRDEGRWDEDERGSRDRPRERYPRYDYDTGRVAYGPRSLSGYRGLGYGESDRDRYRRAGFGREERRGTGDEREGRYGSARYGERDTPWRERTWEAGGYDEPASRRGSSWRDEAGEERGWWDRTRDEVRAWMGDEEAERRRRMDQSSDESGDEPRRGYCGRGPRGYKRSDQRILEDVSDRLTDDWRVDASDIEVKVVNGEVTLSGTVDSRRTRRLAEDIAAEVSGVRDVQNGLRVRPRHETNLTGASSAALEQTTGVSSGTSTGTSTTPAPGSTPPTAKH